MTPIVQKLKDLKPDVLIAISFPNDAILFQRKAKELDFYVSALIGVSAGYSNPDLRGSIGDMVDGIFVSDFAAKVNPKALMPETVKIAEEFFKRYDAKLHRPPAGHASSSFSATWALFTEVLPKAKSLDAPELREIALKLDLPNGALVNGSGIKFTNNDWGPDPEGCRTKSARLHRRVAVAEVGQQPGVPEKSRYTRAGHGSAPGVEQALTSYRHTSNERLSVVHSALGVAFARWWS